MSPNDHDDAWDDRVLGALLVGLGGLRVLIALVDHEQFGTEATLAAIAVAIGVLVLGSAGLRRAP